MLHDQSSAPARNTIVIKVILQMLTAVGTICYTALASMEHALTLGVTSCSGSASVCPLAQASDKTSWSPFHVSVADRSFPRYVREYAAMLQSEQVQVRRVLRPWDAVR